MTASGLAVPRARVRRGRGWVAAAAFDEDVVTLGAAAALPLLDAHPDVRPRALLLATTSSPLAEGGVAQALAEALGIAGDDLSVAEHGGTVAAGGAALTAAIALAASGLGPVLVVAADVRRDERGPVGDGAAAALVTGTSSGGLAVAEVAATGARAELFRDRWRLDGQSALRDADSSLRKAAPGLSADVQVRPDGPSIERLGALGCAGLLASVLLRLAESDEGDRFTASVSAGGVSHAFEVVACGGAREAGEAALAAVAAGEEGPLPPEPAVEGFDPYASQARAWRDRGMDLRLEGLRDPATGEVLFPPPPHLDGAEPLRLSRRGTVYTAARDHVFPYGGPLTMAVVDLDGGGRFYGQVADGRDVEIGDRVELVLRRLHSGGGLPQHYYKIAVADRATTTAQKG